MTISYSKKANKPEDVLIRDMGGESVLLNLENENYYGLDEVGTQVITSNPWSALTAANGAISES